MRTEAKNKDMPTDATNGNQREMTTTTNATNDSTARNFGAEWFKSGQQEDKWLLGMVTMDPHGNTRAKIEFVAKRGNGGQGKRGKIKEKGREKRTSAFREWSRDKGESGEGQGKKGKGGRRKNGTFNTFN